MHLSACIDPHSLAEGYNRGIAQAKGQYLILSHDDIRTPTPDFAQRVAAHLEIFDLIGDAGTTRVVGGAWFVAGPPFIFMLVTSPAGEPGKYVMWTSAIAHFCMGTGWRCAVICS